MKREGEWERGLRGEEGAGRYDWRMAKPRVRSRWALWAAACTVVTVVVVEWSVAIDLDAHRRVEESTITLAVTAKNYPTARAFRVSTGRGEVYECVLPKPVGVLPSGPPACTFDADGQRVRWTADDGEAAEYVNDVRKGVRTAVELEVIVREVGG